MIVQGSNLPLIITLEETVEDMTNLTISMWDARQNLVKEWTQGDVVIDGNVITCPLKETETAAFPRGVLGVEVKCLSGFNTAHWAEAQIEVVARNDKRFILGG